MKVRGKAATLCCTLPLPRHFRRDDILAFHRRDAEKVAERVDAGVLQKGLVWGGRPACLTLRFGARRAEADLGIDAAALSGRRAFVTPADCGAFPGGR